ncbi:pentapeptide repeat-containing protein [Nonomuraea sp. NPDC050451]|uniref:pentapeptide repeat-containing protein n=1 Tax=Nonomuraea sp. NPDC050451 TaxID=3364364 RepID=UPI0037989E7E
MKAASIIVAVLVLVVVPALVWMLGPGAAWVLEHIDQVTTLQDKDRANALAAIRGNVLAVATGLAALLAVYYTARNADTARRTFRLTERGHDTDRFSKAVEQLGSAQAPVRLGGLYALEQLGQNNPALRQTIVDVICAYLRMPYDPPQEEDRHGRVRTAQRAARANIARRASNSVNRNPHEEQQVRLTAQRILADHLRWRKPRRWQRVATANPLFWQDIDLDLTGATLLNIDLNECRINQAMFGRAIFYNGPWFGDATFNARAWFAGATFTGGAADVGAFARATFKDDAVFQGATFGSLAQFHGATFARGAWFAGTTFNNATFTEATFDGEAEFGGAIFMGDARFSKAIFTGAARFRHVDRGSLDLSEARVTDPDGNHAWPPGWRLDPLAKEAVLRRDVPEQQP